MPLRSCNVARSDCGELSNLSINKTVTRPLHKSSLRIHTILSSAQARKFSVGSVEAGTIVMYHIRTRNFNRSHVSRWVVSIWTL